MTKSKANDRMKQVETYFTDMINDINTQLDYNFKLELPLDGSDDEVVRAYASYKIDNMKYTLFISTDCSVSAPSLNCAMKFGTFNLGNERDDVKLIIDIIKSHEAVAKKQGVSI
jgi:hypothetical protein